MIAALVLAAAMVPSMSSVSARADEVTSPLVRPSSRTRIRPPDTQVTSCFYNPTATSVRFVADIRLRSWVDQTNTTIYQPQQYPPGLMRGAGAYDVQMTNAGDATG